MDVFSETQKDGWRDDESILECSRMTHIDLMKVEEEWLIYMENSDCCEEDEAVIERSTRSSRGLTQ